MLQLKSWILLQRNVCGLPKYMPNNAAAPTSEYEADAEDLRNPGKPKAASGVKRLMRAHTLPGCRLGNTAET
ncbi:MAG: hypothetical protein AAB150_03430 [Pseudomonadota bacterium]